MADEETKVSLSPLRWRFGDSNMRCEDCGSEVWGFKEGRICSGCGREEPEPEEKPGHQAVAMPDDLRQRYEAALDDLDFGHDQQERRYVFFDDALAAVKAVRDEEMVELREQVAFEKHRAATYLADYNFLDLQFKAQARELARLKAEGPRDA